MDENNVSASEEDMIDIQIEESLVKESLMVIDSASVRKDAAVLAGFIAIFALALAYGFAGPSARAERADAISMERPVFNNTYVGMSALNRFVSLSAAFSGPKSAECTRASIVMRMDCLQSGRVVHTLSANFRTQKLCAADSGYRVRFFKESVVDFDKIAVEISVSGAPNVYSTGEIVFEYGNEDHTLFQTYIRVVFAGINCIFLWLLYRKLSYLPWKLWHLEQKITVPFLLLAVLYSNPFYLIQAFYPSTMFLVFEKIVNSLFKTYFKFFVLVMFDSLRYKNRKTSMAFYLPKVMFLLVYFFLMIVHGIYDIVLLSSNSTSDISGTSLHKVLSQMEWIMFLAYVSWTAIIFVLSWRNVDVTEKNKFNIYAFINGITMLILVAVNIVVFLKKLSFDTDYYTMSFTLIFVVQNVYVLLNAYFHWPYDTLQDAYDNDGKQQPTIEPNDFFVDEKNQ